MANTKGQALIDEITAEYVKNDTPEFRPGDSVKVFVKNPRRRSYKTSSVRRISN